MCLGQLFNTVDGHFHLRTAQVKLHWAPLCRGSRRAPAVGVGIDEVLDDQEHENRLDGGRRAIIVTVFGVWDADHGTRDEAALNACSDVVRRLTRLGQTPTTSETAVNNDARPPVVFLLQNNPFLSGPKQDFMNDFHQVQREIVDSGEENEVYIVHDRESVFDRLSGYRMSESIHFVDPVKLIEGKMLWGLIALIDGASTRFFLPPLFLSVLLWGDTIQLKTPF